MKRVRILVVEDEPKMVRLLARGLAERGAAVETVRTGEDAIVAARDGDFDVVLLDVMLPDVDGFEVCRRLRSHGVWTPVLMLTARLRVADRVEGLGVGDVAQRFSAAARQQGREITATGDFPVWARADRARLDQALSNLLDNALRHGAGEIALTARRDDPSVVIGVTDEGPGLSPEARQWVFEPFGREVRADGPGGSGLGLAIVRAIVDRHRGSIRVVDQPSGDGVAMELSLPLSQPMEGA
jgi:signal transduction histidine kinase